MTLEDENMQNPSKILGHVWNKQENTLEIQVPTVPENEPVTKRSILSQLGKVYLRSIGHNITYDGRRKTYLQRGL